jgi:hypothetical protein
LTKIKFIARLLQLFPRPQVRRHRAEPAASVTIDAPRNVGIMTRVKAGNRATDTPHLEVEKKEDRRIRSLSEACIFAVNMEPIAAALFVEAQLPRRFTAMKSARSVRWHSRGESLAGSRPMLCAVSREAAARSGILGHPQDDWDNLAGFIAC